MGITALAKPDPRTKMMKKLEAPRTTAASDTTPYQPTITTSVTCSAIWASCAPASGRPSARVSRAWVVLDIWSVMGGTLTRPAPHLQDQPSAAPQRQML